MARGRQGDPAVLALAYRVIGAVHAEYSDAPVPWSVLERATGETEVRLGDVSRVVEGLDSSIRLTDDGYEIDSDVHDDQMAARIDGGAALVSRVHARPFEALGVDGRKEMFCCNQGTADEAAALEQIFNSLVNRLDEFLTRLDLGPAPAQPKCAESILAMFDPTADEPWGNAYSLSAKMSDSDGGIEIRPTGLLWSDDQWWVQQSPPEWKHVDHEIALEAIVSCD